MLVLKHTFSLKISSHGINLQIQENCRTRHLSLINFGSVHSISNQMNIFMKSFKKLTSLSSEEELRISPSPWSAKSLHHQSHVSSQITISQTAFEKDHTRNNSMKLF